jgi:hypothetical protein
LLCLFQPFFYLLRMLKNQSLLSKEKKLVTKTGEQYEVIHGLRERNYKAHEEEFHLHYNKFSKREKFQCPIYFLKKLVRMHLSAANQIKV